MINYKYCPQCRSGLGKKEDCFYCKVCKIKIYQNSTPAVGILLIKNDKVLLAKRARKPNRETLDSIGGFLKYGEGPQKAVLREAKEETGFTVKITNLLGVYTDTYGKTGEPVILTYYLGKIVTGNMKAQDDVASLHWIPIEKIPYKKVAFKSIRKALKDLQKWHKV